jgi:hypothetical protein
MAKARDPYTTYGNSQEEADALLALDRQNRRVVMALLREKIAFLEAKSADRTIRAIEDRSLTGLQRRLTELEGRR